MWGPIKTEIKQVAQDSVTARKENIKPRLIEQTNVLIGAAF